MKNNTTAIVTANNTTTTNNTITMPNSFAELKAHAISLGIDVKGLRSKEKLIAAIHVAMGQEIDEAKIVNKDKLIADIHEAMGREIDEAKVNKPEPSPATTPELPTWDEELIMTLRLMRPWDGNQGWVKDEKTGRWYKGPRSVFYVADHDEYKGKVVSKWNTLFKYVEEWQKKYVNTRKNGVGIDQCSAKSAKIYLDLLFKRGWLEWGTEKKGTMQGHQNEVHCLVIMTTKVNQCQKKVLDYWHYEHELKEAQKSTTEQK